MFFDTLYANFLKNLNSVETLYTMVYYCTIIHIALGSYWVCFARVLEKSDGVLKRFGSMYICIFMYFYRIKTTEEYSVAWTGRTEQHELLLSFYVISKLIEAERRIYALLN